MAHNSMSKPYLEDKHLFTEVYRSNILECVKNPQSGLAFSLWEMSRLDGDIPEESAFLRSVPRSMFPDLMVLRTVEGGQLKYEHYGSNIAMRAGFDMTGRLVSDFKGALGIFYNDIYQEVFAERKPLATVHRLGHFRERPLWERVILPVHSQGSIHGLYVINTVREVSFDVSYLKTKSRSNGLFALQFEHDDRGKIIDAVIVGANQAALKMTGRRLDELLDQSATRCFPGIQHLSLWQKCTQVAESRSAQNFDLDYEQDGMKRVIRFIVEPFHDGISVEFSPLDERA